MDGLEIVECVAYRLESLSGGSFNDLDGEVVESGPIQGHGIDVFPHALLEMPKTKRTYPL